MTPDLSQIAARYRRFAAVEAAGHAPLYEALATGVAASPKALAFLAQLPTERQQPNLFLAALRHVTGRVIAPHELQDILADHGTDIATVMRSRSTQTNEPARCAALLPALAQIQNQTQRPLALIEVGASAGLCLLPDAYGYAYSGDGRQTAVPAPTPTAPVFSCQTTGHPPLPQQHPDIIWRAGLDLNPLDLRNPDDTAWLKTLVWPEQDARLARLRASIAVAQANPPRICAGDLTCDIAALMAEAPQDATLVVFHTAVLTYVQNQAARDRFSTQMLNSRAVWLSNEGLRVFPHFAGSEATCQPDKFLLLRDGQPLARTGPHGQSLDWIDQAG